MRSHTFSHSTLLSDASPQKHIRRVSDFYNRVTKWYHRFWYDQESLGIHYGFYETPKTPRSEAFLNQY